jgi:hypothetical protein
VPASFNSSQLKTCKMKSKIIVVLIAATALIIFIACNWLSSKPKETAFNIQGKWKVDSVENNGTDSNRTALLVWSLAKSDSVAIQFNADSTFNYSDTADLKGKYYVSEKENMLFVKEDSTYQPLKFISRSDSAFTVSTADSLIIHLRKQ